MRAAIYTRVSQDPKAQGRSVSEQEHECRAVCEREGWEVAQVFSDNDRSASRYAKKGRPEYEALKRTLQNGGIDVLVTWEATRAQRDLEAYVLLRETCRTAGVLWSYSGRTYDLARTDDRFATGLDALLAERESDVTRDRILRNVRANAAEGRPHGKIPYGYAREYDPSTGALLRQVIRHDQAEVVREAASRFLAGETPYAIAQDLNARGVPAARGGPWNLTQVRRILTNPLYVAQRVHRGEVVGEATWPPILDDVTFLRCKTRFADPKRKTTNEHAIKFLLSGLAQCGVCGARIKVGRPRGRDSYICSESFCVARSVSKVDDLIERVVVARLSRPDAVGLLAPADAATGEVLDQIAEKRARLEDFYDQAADGLVSPVALARIEARLLPEVKALEAQVHRLDMPPVLYDLATAPGAVWGTLALTQRRLVITTLMEVRILKTLRGARSLDPRSVEVCWTGRPGGPPPAQG
jgi:site-specific DNA recombinase